MRWRNKNHAGLRQEKLNERKAEEAQKQKKEKKKFASASDVQPLLREQGLNTCHSCSGRQMRT